MSIMDDIRQLEQEIADGERLVEQRKMAMKLSENFEFRKLFMEEFFVNEVARNVAVATDPAMTDPGMRADALDMAKAGAHAKRYLSAKIQMGAHYERNLPAMRAALEELRIAAEQGSDDAQGGED